MLRHVSLLAAILTLGACAGRGGSASPADTAHVDAMSHEHAADAPVANASSSMEPRQPVSAAEVIYGNDNGHPLRGYMAAPTSAGTSPLPGVLMIHEWWGLNDNIRATARRLAGEGYRVLAVDLYGRTATSPAEARTLMMGVMQDRPAAGRNLTAAAELMRGQMAAPRLGVIGWCFGGGWSLQTALLIPDRIDAAAIYYGQPVTDRTQLARVRAPLAGFFGLRDQGIPADSVRRMEAELHALGKSTDFHFYDAGHGFANPSGTSYNAAAAADAWTRTLALFDANLKRH